MRRPFRFAPYFGSGSRGVLHPPIANGAADGASWILSHTRGAPRPPSHRSRPSPAPGSAVPKPILYGSPGAPYNISSLRVTPDGTGDGGPGLGGIGRRGVPAAARQLVPRSHGVLGARRDRLAPAGSRLKGPHRGGEHGWPPTGVDCGTVGMKSQNRARSFSQVPLWVPPRPTRRPIGTHPAAQSQVEWKSVASSGSCGCHFDWLLG